MTDAPSFSTLIARLEEQASGVLTRALRHGGRYADLFCERTVHHRRRLRWEQARGAAGGTRQQAAGRVVEGVGVRVLGEEQVGFAAAGGLSVRACEAAAEEAAARFGRDGTPAGAAPPVRRAVCPDLPDDAPDAVAASEKAAQLQAAADAACSLEARVRRVEVAYHDRVRRTAVVTSDGTMRVEASMLLGLRVGVTLAAERGDVTAYAVAGGASGFGAFFAHPPEQVAREAVERVRRLAEAKPLPPGEMPVVLGAGWNGVWLHEAVGHMLEADAVASGASPFAGCLGRAVSAPTVALVDDATLPGGRGSHRFDDEGTPASRTTLIEEGVLRAFLTDRRTAHRMGLPCTGNGRRQDYRHAPLPRMTNLLLLAGEAEPGDLVADVKDGLYVAAVGPGVVRPGAGFAFDVLEGYRIEQGVLTAPVARACITGAGPEALRGIVGVGRDVQVDTARGLCRKAGQVVPVSVGMPTVLIRTMHVEATG